MTTETNKLKLKQFFDALVEKITQGCHIDYIGIIESVLTNAQADNESVKEFYNAALSFFKAKDLSKSSKEEVDNKPPSKEELNTYKSNLEKQLKEIELKNVQHKVEFIATIQAATEKLGQEKSKQFGENKISLKTALSDEICLNLADTLLDGVYAISFDDKRAKIDFRLLEKFLNTLLINARDTNSNILEVVATIPHDFAVFISRQSAYKIKYPLLGSIVKNPQQFDIVKIVSQCENLLNDAKAPMDKGSLTDTADIIVILRLLRNLGWFLDSALCAPNKLNDLVAPYQDDTLIKQLVVEYKTAYREMILNASVLVHDCEYIPRESEYQEKLLNIWRKLILAITARNSKQEPTKKTKSFYIDEADLSKEGLNRLLMPVSRIVEFANSELTTFRGNCSDNEGVMTGYIMDYGRSGRKATRLTLGVEQKEVQAGNKLEDLFEFTRNIQLDKTNKIKEVQKLNKLLSALVTQDLPNMVNDSLFGYLILLVNGSGLNSQLTIGKPLVHINVAMDKITLEVSCITGEMSIDGGNDRMSFPPHVALKIRLPIEIKYSEGKNNTYTFSFDPQQAQVELGVLVNPNSKFIPKLRAGFISSGKKTDKNSDFFAEYSKYFLNFLNPGLVDKKKKTQICGPYKVSELQSKGPFTLFSNFKTQIKDAGLKDLIEDIFTRLYVDQSITQAAAALELIKYISEINIKNMCLIDKWQYSQLAYMAYCVINEFYKADQIVLADYNQAEAILLQSINGLKTEAKKLKKINTIEELHIYSEMLDSSIELAQVNHLSSKCQPHFLQNQIDCITAIIDYIGVQKNSTKLYDNGLYCQYLLKVYEAILQLKKRNNARYKEFAHFASKLEQLLVDVLRQLEKSADKKVDGKDLYAKRCEFDDRLTLCETILPKTGLVKSESLSTEFKNNIFDNLTRTANNIFSKTMQMVCESDAAPKEELTANVSTQILRARDSHILFPQFSANDEIFHKTLNDISKSKRKLLTTQGNSCNLADAINLCELPGENPGFVKDLYYLLEAAVKDNEVKKQLIKLLINPEAQSEKKAYDIIRSALKWQHMNFALLLQSHPGAALTSSFLKDKDILESLSGDMIVELALGHPNVLREVLIHEYKVSRKIFGRKKKVSDKISGKLVARLMASADLDDIADILFKHYLNKITPQALAIAILNGNHETHQKILTNPKLLDKLFSLPAKEMEEIIEKSYTFLRQALEVRPDMQSEFLVNGKYAHSSLVLVNTILRAEIEFNKKGGAAKPADITTLRSYTNELTPEAASLLAAMFLAEPAKRKIILSDKDLYQNMLKLAPTAITHSTQFIQLFVERTYDINSFDAIVQYLAELEKDEKNKSYIDIFCKYNPEFVQKLLLPNKKTEETVMTLSPEHEQLKALIQGTEGEKKAVRKQVQDIVLALDPKESKSDDENAPSKSKKNVALRSSFKFYQENKPLHDSLIAETDFFCRRAKA